MPSTILMEQFFMLIVKMRKQALRNNLLMVSELVHGKAEFKLHLTSMFLPRDLGSLCSWGHILPFEAVCAPRSRTYNYLLSPYLDRFTVWSHFIKMKLDKMVNFVVDFYQRKKGKILLSICLVLVTTEPVWSIPKCYCCCCCC